MCHLIFGNSYWLISHKKFSSLNGHKCRQIPWHKCQNSRRANAPLRLSERKQEHVYREISKSLFSYLHRATCSPDPRNITSLRAESPLWHWDTSIVWFHQSMPFERKECMRGRERRESHLFSLLGTSGRLESIAEACESNSGGGLLTNKPFWVTRFNESLLLDIGENEKHTTVQSDLDAAAPGILIHDITTYSNHSFLYVIFPQSNLLAGLMQNTKS